MIEYITDVIIIIISFTIFGFLHSYLATNKIKNKLTEKFGAKIAFYRLFYNLIAILIFYLLFRFLPRPGLELYNLPNPYDIIILIPQFAALAGFFWVLNYFCVKEFLGINQIIRWKNNQYNVKELDEHLTLRIKGPYKFSRHPLYFFSIMFLVLRPTMDLFYLTFVACIIAYFYVGSIYEEKKLVERFGEQYLEYRKEVPRIMPVKLFNPYTEKFRTSENNN